MFPLFIMCPDLVPSIITWFTITRSKQKILVQKPLLHLVFWWLTNILTPEEINIPTCKTKELN
jgi:hypothetical protein